MNYATILWRRLDTPGHDAARLFFQDSYWRLSGTAILAHARKPCRLDYEVMCNVEWQTLSARVAGWVGLSAVRIDVTVDSPGRWKLNGADIPKVSGCIDVDLAFTPSTNLLPIRRLSLAIGQRAAAPAAWMTFPSLRLERLEQIYERTNATTYRYESGGGGFETELEVNSDGFVTHYPDIWRVEAQQSASGFSTNQS